MKRLLFLIPAILFVITLFWSLTPSQIKVFARDNNNLLNGGKSQPKSKYKYVGLEKCASVCHDNDEMGSQYDIVKNSPHSNAFHVLGGRKARNFASKAKIEGNPGNSPVCLNCHTTGYGLDPSSYAETFKKEDGITCEACHKGPLGSQTVMPDEAVCLKCHSGSVHPVKKFVYDQRIALLAHPRKKIIFDNGPGVKIADNAGILIADGKSHKTGEIYGGGIVFYTFDNGLHGLIAAPQDQGAGIQWYNGIDRSTGSSGDGVYAGKENTEKIVSGQMNDNGPGKFAAKICADYSVTVNGVTYDDWYLPSRSELNLLYLCKDIVGGFSRAYWSSTEAGPARAWLQYFNDGFRFSYSGKNYPGFVRAIRAF